MDTVIISGIVSAKRICTSQPLTSAKSCSADRGMCNAHDEHQCLDLDLRLVGWLRVELTYVVNGAYSRLLCAAGTVRSSKGVMFTRSTFVLVLARIHTPSADSIALALFIRGPAWFVSLFLEAESGCNGVRAGSARRYGNRSHDDSRTQRVCPTVRNKTKSNPRTMLLT